MQLSLDKHVKVTFKKGSLVKSKKISLDQNTKITELEQNGTYRYSGINEANGINHIIIKEWRKNMKRILSGNKSQIKNRIEWKKIVITINNLAISVLTYSFNIIKLEVRWNKKDGYLISETYNLPQNASSKCR